MSFQKLFAFQLFSSKRRVRIFLMDAEEEEEEDEDDIDGDITSQSEADQSAINMADIIQSASSSKNTSQSEVSMQMDVSDVGGEDEQEDKENSSSLASSGDHSNNV